MALSAYARDVLSKMRSRGSGGFAERGAYSAPPRGGGKPPLRGRVSLSSALQRYSAAMSDGWRYSVAGGDGWRYSAASGGGWRYSTAMSDSWRYSAPMSNGRRYSAPMSYG